MDLILRELRKTNRLLEAILATLNSEDPQITPTGPKVLEGIDKEEIVVCGICHEKRPRTETLKADNGYICRECMGKES